MERGDGGWAVGEDDETWALYTSGVPMRRPSEDYSPASLPDQPLPIPTSSRPHHHHHHRHHRVHADEQTCGSKWWLEIWEDVTDGYILVHLFCWLLFLIVGTAFYADGGGGDGTAYGIYRGFYYAINVGYSVGWCYSEDETEAMQTFSSLYCFAGMFLLAYFVIYFSHKLFLYHSRWDQQFLELKHETKRAENAKRRHADNFCLVFLDDCWLYYAAHFMLFNTWGVYALLLAFLWLWGCLRYGWSVVTGWYFAVGCLSTSGMISIPDDSADVDYFVVGVITALGVPVLNLALFGVMTAIVRASSLSLSIDEIFEGVSLTELRAIRALHVDEDQGVLAPMNANEYVVLILMRLGSLNHEMYR